MPNRRRVRWSAALGPLVLLAILLAIGGLALAHTTHVSVDPQVAVDGTVQFEGVFSAAEGWVVLHQLNETGELGEGIVRERIDTDAGFRTDVVLQLPDDRWRNVTDAIRLGAAIHTDDGDGRYEPDQDSVAESFGQRAVERFTLGRGAARASVHALTFAPIEVPGDTVPIRAVQLPTSGHVVVANRTDEGPGQILGSQRLDAGRHVNVTVPIDREALPAERPTSLLATLYTDDGDGRYDADDEPILAGEEAVRTRFSVERTPPNGTENVSAPENTTDQSARDAPGPGATGAALAIGAAALVHALRTRR